MIYINDIDDFVASKILKFADDNKIIDKKLQNNKATHRHIVSMLTSNITFLIFAVLVV